MHRWRLTSRKIARRVAAPVPSHSRSFASRTPSLASTTPRLRNEDDRYHQSSTAAIGESAGKHEGSASRTDNTIYIEYPAEDQMKRETTVQGRGGPHGKRTLASFSLEDRVTVISGGARGLGLVMGQACMQSGSDLAIVDLNSTLYTFNVFCLADRNRG